MGIIVPEQHCFSPGLGTTACFLHVVRKGLHVNLVSMPHRYKKGRKKTHISLVFSKVNACC